ncbi:hypothetical protein DERP_005976 [Dermatophagoides pteronyssinus]|uniref:Uncharacterized protein n=1 Tax=Dermatophagoides pteronyssinus TaxID=6956 RepID=A0ABQ8JSF6_DERPT|nr:hypothetical protein DERP_005976 [Dermatophagoides pteronyssinus]
MNATVNDMNVLKTSSIIVIIINEQKKIFINQSINQSREKRVNIYLIIYLRSINCNFIGRSAIRRPKHILVP